MSLETRWKKFLQSLRNQGTFRSFQSPTGLDFTSNDYLGYGSGRRGPPSSQRECNLNASGMASRLLRGHHPIWEEVEELLSTWHGSESALIMTSGYVANEGLLATVISPEDWVASDELNHSSIIDGLRLCRAERFIYRHLDLNQLEEGLAEANRNKIPDRELFLVTESMFSMEGDRAPLTELAGLANMYGANLIVDEAHATGFFGPRGGGIVNELNLRDHVLATVHTGGKALGCCGAYLCCQKWLKTLLVNRCRHLIYTTALPPATALRWLEILPYVQADEDGRNLLQRNINYFRTKLHEAGITPLGNDFIVPIVLSDNNLTLAIANYLQLAGVDIRAIRPPTVPIGTSRLRISLHADHKLAELDKVANGIEEALQIFGRNSA